MPSVLTPALLVRPGYVVTLPDEEGRPRRGTVAVRPRPVPGRPDLVSFRFVDSEDETPYPIGDLVTVQSHYAPSSP